MMYGTKVGYSLTWKSNISQAEPSLDERRFERVRCARHVSFPSLGHYSRWWTASPIKNQFQDQLRLGQVITGSGCNSSERFEKEYVGKCGDLSTFHYSREAYGPRIDLLPPRPFHLFLLSLLFLLSPCDTWPERKKSPATSLSYQKAKWLRWKSVLSYKFLDGSLKRSIIH